MDDPVGETGALETTGHDTNKAFMRYCQVQDPNALKMAGVVKKIQHNNVVDLMKKKRGD